jgi:hypothetical protein
MTRMGTLWRLLARMRLRESIMTELQKVSAETMRFMRGKYKLDEVPGKYHDIDCLIFRQGNKTILTINICEDRFEFHIVYGKAQREKFDAVRDSFPSFIRDIYDSCLTYNNCKYMLIPVADLETLEAIKQMIMIKKIPTANLFQKNRLSMAVVDTVAICVFITRAGH